MIPVQRWSGREARLLRDALRMSVRVFASHLGVSDRTVANWDAGGQDLFPGPDSQALLDTCLDRAGDDAKQRFFLAMGTVQPGPPQSEGTFRLDSHKFIPIFVGIEAAKQMIGDVSFTPDHVTWLECHRRRLSHPDGECVLYVFECGVAVMHLHQTREPDTLTNLAVWRYTSYTTDLPWCGDQVVELLGPSNPSVGAPEYVLSLYHLRTATWRGSRLDTALRLMSVPSVLVDRRSPGGPRPLAAEVEESLLSGGFEHPDVVPFGVQGVSIGYAGWSGVAYHVLSPERALAMSELVECEVVVQLLWCYCHRIQTKVENGQDPSVPETFGWRYLRAAYSRLTTARAQETSQHCLMRDAIVETSGLLRRLNAAQDALRHGLLAIREGTV